MKSFTAYSLSLGFSSVLAGPNLYTPPSIFFRKKPGDTVDGFKNPAWRSPVEVGS